MSVLSPISLVDSSGGIPPIPVPSIGCDEAEFPTLLRRYRLGLALFVAAVVMLFVGFGSAYVVRRGIPTYDAGTGAYSAAWEPLRLPIGILFMNTCFLLSASGAVEIVRRKTRAVMYGVERINRGIALWLNGSLLLGAGFLVGQGIAWHSLTSKGQFLNTGARTAFFYVLTGTHAVHALVGVLALAAIAVLYSRMSFPRKYLCVDLTAWYLHSMTLLWISLFSFVAFA
jgi:cytochrome c oxidase subunit III